MYIRITVYWTCSYRNHAYCISALQSSSGRYIYIEDKTILWCNTIRPVVANWWIYQVACLPNGMRRIFMYMFVWSMGGDQSAEAMSVLNSPSYLNQILDLLKGGVMKTRGFGVRQWHHWLAPIAPEALRGAVLIIQRVLCQGTEMSLWCCWLMPLCIWLWATNAIWTVASEIWILD